MAVIRTSQEAVGALADALWWFRGFGADTTSDLRDEVFGLANALCEARLWIDRVVEGKVRRLGDDEHGSVVLTYAEFERLIDATHSLQSEEQLRACDTLKVVLAEYQHEALATRNLPEVQF